MSGVDNFLLTRPEHQTSLARSIQEEREFCDVSLACEDQQVRAHKVVLAASSTKLRNILLSNPHPQPLIYLSGVRYAILEKILRFIYHGQVDISQDQINSFMDIAEDLQVKGLTESTGGGQTGGEVSTSSSRMAETVTASSPSGESTNTRNRERSSVEREDQESPSVLKQPVDQELVEEYEGEPSFHYYDHLPRPTQEEELLRPRIENMITADIADDEEGGEYEDGDDHYQDYEDGDYHYQDYEDGDDWNQRDIPVGEKKNICPYCNKSFRNAYLKRHIKVHTKEKPFSCPECSKSFSEKNKLNRHQKTVHLGERPHQCPHCDETFSQNNHLNRHIQRKHQ